MKHNSQPIDNSDSGVTSHSLPHREGRGGSYGGSYTTASWENYGLLREFARENRKNQTDAESALWNYLRDRTLGTKFLRQHIIGNYIGDFVSTDKKIVIEVDGGYHSQYIQMQYDEKRTEHIESIGYKVIRFTNEQILFDTENVITQIKELINKSI